MLGRGRLRHGSICYVNAVSAVGGSCGAEGAPATGVEKVGPKDRVLVRGWKIKGRGEVVGGGSEEDEAVSDGDGLDGEAVGEEGGVEEREGEPHGKDGVKSVELDDREGVGVGENGMAMAKIGLWWWWWKKKKNFCECKIF
ncbi:hypothetical protein GYH30_029107 [Glycine max]|nr:hypothetical protein GYH30_029107 [Glycine max]